MKKLGREKYIIVNLILNSLLLVILHFTVWKMNIIMVLVFGFMPTLISAVLFTLEIKKYNLTEFAKKSVIYTALNGLYIYLVSTCIMTPQVTLNILKLSEKYNSKYVTVNQQQSPLLGSLLVIILTYAVLYIVGGMTKKKLGEA